MTIPISQILSIKFAVYEMIRSTLEENWEMRLTLEENWEIWKTDFQKYEPSTATARNLLT